MRLKETWSRRQEQAGEFSQFPAFLSSPLRMAGIRVISNAATIFEMRQPQRLRREERRGLEGVPAARIRQPASAALACQTASVSSNPIPLGKPTPLHAAQQTCHREQTESIIA